MLERHKRLLQLIKRIASVDLHYGVSLFVICNHKRHSKTHRNLQLRKSLDSRNQATGGDGDPSVGDVNSILPMYVCYGRHDFCEIGKRLSHSHEYYMGDVLTKLLQMDQLLHYFSSLQVPHQAHGACPAEGAAHGASHLA